MTIVFITPLSFELNTNIRVDYQWCQTSIILQFFKDSIALNYCVTRLEKNKPYSLQSTVYISHYFPHALLIILKTN